MATSEYRIGPDGSDVKCYRRSARQIRAGDWLPEWSRYALTDAVTDDSDGRHYVTLTYRPGDWSGVTDDDVVSFTPRGRAWLYRTYDPAPWHAAALAAYESACATRERLRESGEIVPTSVPGVAGSSVAYYQLEADAFNRAHPAPRLADYLRSAAADYRAERDRGMVDA